MTKLPIKNDAQKRLDEALEKRGLVKKPKGKQKEKK